MFTEEELEARLKEDFPVSYIKITDYIGDGNHFKLEIKSEKLSDISRIAQQKMIMKSLDCFYKKGLHALEIKVLKI